jgi:hypothetical protein
MLSWLSGDRIDLEDAQGAFAMVTSHGEDRIQAKGRATVGCGALGSFPNLISRRLQENENAVWR